MLTDTAKGPSGTIPSSRSAEYLDLYRYMLTARYVDEIEKDLVDRGEAFFHVSGAGHEGAAVLARHLAPEDWLHCHYRDKALLLARGVPPKAFFDSLLCNAHSHSAGRQMSAHMSDPERRILSTVGPVGNSALQAVGVAAEVQHQRATSIVVCSVGDGTTQQGEFLEAIAESVRRELPVLFWIADNHLAISTRTAGKTFYHLPGGKSETFYGVQIYRLNGRDVVACDGALRGIVARVRDRREPAIVVFDVERLADHTNADDERVYRRPEEIEASRYFGDPIRRLEEQLMESGVSGETLELRRTAAREAVERAAFAARKVGDPAPTFAAKRHLAAPREASPDEYTGHGDGPRLTMLEAMRSVLDRWLSDEVRVTLYGEDIEDPKGDVFGLTRGLSSRYPGRVVNSALSESTIVGTSIGRALAGGRPVACIQFADFLPLAWNQIASELGSMYWRTNGGWECPVIVMVPCGGYRPGLGPFHAQTHEASLAHIPGVDVFLPSSAGDAAGLLNAAFESKRPTLFLYPKVCLNDPDRSTSNDVGRQIVPIGKARFLQRGDDITIVTWGSTVPVCEKVARTLREAGVGVDLIDLRSISPWDKEAVAESARKTGTLLTVHEDSLTCGFGAEVVAATVETVGKDVRCRRLARPDTYVPCNYTNQIEILPSYRRGLEYAADMVGLRFSWHSERKSKDDGDLFVVRAQGSSPADQSVTVVAWHVQEGESIQAGQVIGEAEADKAVSDIKSPVSGTVAGILVPEGMTVRVGTGLLRLKQVSAAEGEARGDTCEAVPRLRAREVSIPEKRGRRAVAVAMSGPYCAAGSMSLDNEEIAKTFPDRTPEAILRLTGIQSRHRLAPGETVLDLAVRASTRALREEGLSVQDLDSIVCSTTTPLSVSPSMACRILHALYENGSVREIPAHDVSAACTGYLYALAAGYDFVQAHPRGTVLVVTAEALSTVVNRDDFDTSVLFGDAASATILRGRSEGLRGRSEDSRGVKLIRRPVLSARGEDGSALLVPHPGTG